MKQIKHLRLLRKRLARLRRRRQRFRWATAASALAIALLWVLAGVFALDWCFQRNIDLWQRLLLEGLAAAGLIWAFARFARPWLGKRENEMDMALLVQRQVGIDSDLVAALQFESADAARWGSTQLEAAVIDRVAHEERSLDVMAAMPRQPLLRRLKVLVATAALWAVLALLLPAYLRVFFQRLAFGPQHYPSQTQVVGISVNGKSVDLAAAGERAVHVPYGQAVRFDVAIAGSQPAAGRVEIFMQAGGPAASVQLDPLPGGNSDPPQAQYRGEYARLSQPAHCQVYVGDAWTDPLSLSVTPLPVVEIQAEVVLPDYARRSPEAAPKLPRGMRDFSVLAGSEVKFTLDSDRPLKAVELTIAGQAYAMQRDDSGLPVPAREKKGTASAGGSDLAANTREVWKLAAAGTPLASVAKELAYSIQAHDAEGQSLEQPLEGSVSIEPDQPPSILARTKSTIVLPTGSPNIRYEAADDHALSCIWLTWEAVPGDRDPGAITPVADHASGDSSPAAEKREGRIDVCRFPPETSPRNCAGDYPLALQSLPLKPGDTLKVTFHASDYRGPAAAAVVDADPPLVFQVTDLHGFEASMYEADQKSAGVLEDIRKKHSGLGETQ